MGKSYSLDLRERIVAKVRNGASRREAARQFGVSDSCAVKLLQHVDRTGMMAPARQGRPPGDGKLSPYMDFLIGRVAEKPDITMPELAVELEALHSVRVSPPSLSRVLCKAGFSYKKTVDGVGTRTRGRT